MELLRGESLSAILRRKKRLSPAVAVQTLLPVAGALASAHGKGIIHRDLKPDNVIIIQHENGALMPKIVDFGIAKLLHIERSVTLAGEVLGSPDYMSPEQARGAENVGEATDVWAFSVVLYELLTGARPFDGHNYNALIAAILTNDPLPITARGVADGELGKIIERGLAKDIKDRWQRMKDLGAALAHWAVTHGIEDDVAGTAIAKTWLTSPARRVLTVHPDMDATVALPLDKVAPPAAAADPRSPGEPRPAMETIVGRAPRRSHGLVWVAPVVACAAVVGVAGWLARERIAQSLAGDAAVSAVSAVAPASAAPLVSASPSAAPTASAAPTTSAAVEPPAGAEPAASATAAPTASAKTWKPPKRKAPAVPKKINF
jgi:serine/threonine-protein kinase